MESRHSTPKEGQALLGASNRKETGAGREMGRGFVGRRPKAQDRRGPVHTRLCGRGSGVWVLFCFVFLR